MVGVQDGPPPVVTGGQPLPPPAPPAGPAPAETGWQAAPPPPPRPRWRRAVAVAVAGFVASVVLAVGAVALLSWIREPSTAPPPPSAAPPPAETLSPEAAQAKTCNVLAAGYESVANAIDERNRFNSAPWTDPALLTATNTLVSATWQLADELEASLDTHTPAALKSAVTEYVTGLRALSISQRNHARDMQLNGVGAFYNQVVDAPLRICGIAG